MHHVDKISIIQCIAMTSPAQQVTILNHVQIITMQMLGAVGTLNKNFAYNACIMLDAYLHLLSSKLCGHNWHRPSGNASCT